MQWRAEHRNHDQMVPAYTKINAQIASIIALPSYPTALNSVRLQRVADLMLQFGLLRKGVNVAPMILAPPNSKA